MVTVYIDGIKVTVPEGTTILEAAKIAKVEIPTLCFLERVEPRGACRVCVVEIEGEKRLSPSCKRQVEEGMRIRTNSPRVREARKTIVELLISEHHEDCPSCVKNQECELLALARRLNISSISFPKDEEGGEEKKVDETGLSLIRDNRKCILCGRCVRVCRDIQTVHAIDFVGRGRDLRVSAWLDQGLGNVMCTNCGQCLQVCPVGAIYERSEVDRVWEAIESPDVFVVVQEAPSVRVGLAEALGLPPGTVVTGKMYEALKRLGFDAVCDTNFAADLTIVEEATELIERIKNKGTLPMITSCCPGWIKFMEDNYPDLMDHVSTCKSPQQMFGAVAKTYFAQKRGIDPSKLVCVSIMPCTAKKFEKEREEMKDSGYQDVDFVLTTREIARMIQEAGIDFINLPEGEADPDLGYYTGAGTIFGATGGVMEAALRTAYCYLTGKRPPKLEFEEVRGMEGVRSADITINGMQVKVAVVHELGNARKVLDEIRAGKSPYLFIEIMACPGGCVGGGGQPCNFDLKWREKRAKGLYEDDLHCKERLSHENPAIKRLYKEFLGEPGSELAHKLLHTHYRRRVYS